MNDVSHPLSPQDRIELLCWLTCGILGAFYLNETWPTPDFHVQAAHKWLDRHSRHADWLAISKLAVVAREIAERHAGFVSAEWARDAVEEILDTDDLNHQARLVVKIIHDCQLALADNPVTSFSFFGRRRNRNANRTIPGIIVGRRRRAS